MDVAEAECAEPNCTQSRAEAQSPELASRLEDATGVFMTGGNQLKLSNFIIGTPFADAIHAAYARGAAVGGTSAGASIVAEHMIAFGSGGATPTRRAGDHTREPPPKTAGGGGGGRGGRAGGRGGGGSAGGGGGGAAGGGSGGGGGGGEF